MFRRSLLQFAAPLALFFLLSGCSHNSPSAPVSAPPAAAPAPPLTASQTNQQSLNKAGTMMGALPGVNQNSTQKRLDTMQNHLDQLGKQVNQTDSGQ